MHITRLLRGKTVDLVLQDGQSLIIKLRDGSQVRIAWLDPITQQPVRGMPAIVDLKGIAFTPEEVRPAPVRIIGSR